MDLAATEIDIRTIADALAARGFVHLPAADVQGAFHWSTPGWSCFCETWERLGPDLYMADGGRYRRRRHAAFEIRGQMAPFRKPHQPHFQSRDYNALNGDVQRWFDPIEEPLAGSPIIRAMFQKFTPLFSRLDGRNPESCWHSEVHQFRIEASPTEAGCPTPEGLHRDGVDWVVVMLIARRNVEEGVTVIGDLNGSPLGHFTLRDAGDMVILNDRRIRHGVTPILASRGSLPAHRDAIVVTWQAR